MSAPRFPSRLPLPDLHAVQLVHQLLHGNLLLLDGFDEFELGAAAVEVVAGPMDAEIGIAAEKVREKTNADLERDQLAGKSHERPFRLGQELSGRGQVPF